MKLIKPEHIGTIIRDENEGFWADTETHEVHFGDVDATLADFIEDLKDLYQDEMPIEIGDEDKKLILYLQAMYPESLFEVGDRVFIFPQKIRELTQPGADGIYAKKMLGRIKYIIEKNPKPEEMWPKEFGSQDLKVCIEYLLDWLTRNLPEQEDKTAFSLTVEKHELAHLAFYQKYPEITRKFEQISKKIENAENLTSEEVDYYNMRAALLETDAILTEENPWMFHYRKARLLLGLKTLTGYVEDCENYSYVETMFSVFAGTTHYSKAYFYASCLIAFGAQMLDYDPQKNSLRFNPKFMFGTDSWEEGQQPTHEQMVRFLQRWEAAQMEMLEAGYESYVQRLPVIRQELTAIVQPYLERLEAELEEESRAPVDGSNLHSDPSNQY